MKRISLLVCLLLCVACFLPSCKTDDGIMYDFPSLRINRYCEIEDSAWKDLSLSLDIASYTITDEDVMDYMHEMQASILTGCPAEEKVVDRTIQKGDSIYLYYCGYTEDGVAFQGGCNFGAENPTMLKIGSGTFLPGFEDQLIGVIPNQTSLTKMTTGTIAGTELVYLAYTCQYTDNGNKTSSTFTCQPVNLASAPASYGPTFAEQLSGNEIGSAFSFTEIADFDGDGEDEHKVYNGTVLFVSDETTVTVTLTIPTTYPQNPSLAGKTVTFKVVVDSVVDFVYPELTADFIINKLNYTPTTTDPVAEYKANVKSYLQSQEDAELASAKETLLFNTLVDALTIKKWPKNSVSFFYDAYETSMKEDYEYYKYYYSYYGYTFPFTDVSDYIMSICGIEGATTAEQALQAYAERKVKEQLVIFLLADKLDIKVKRSEMNAQAQIFADMLTENDQSGQKYTASDAYEQYGDILIECSATYNKVMKLIMEDTTFTQS